MDSRMEFLDRLLATMQEQMLLPTAVKPSTPDYLKLLQYYRELGGDRKTYSQVTWSDIDESPAA